jgi:hypothetical protein
MDPTCSTTFHPNTSKEKVNLHVLVFITQHILATEEIWLPQGWQLK